MGSLGMRRLSHAAVAALLVSLLAPTLRAGQLLLASDPSAGALFGSRLVQQGDTLVVGAPYASLPPGSEAGEVYVFRREAGVWSQEALLISPYARPDTFFGGGLALDRETLLVGAGNGGSLSVGGVVHVFVRSAGAWSQQALLKQPDRIVNSWFGMRLALQGDIAIVGAQYDTLPGGPPVTGAVYVFARSGTAWSLVQTLHSPTMETAQQFGSEVALDGATLMVCTRNGEPPLDVTSICVYSRHGTHWSLEQEIRPPESDVGHNWFRGEIALQGDTAMVSVGHATEVQPDEGSVHVYQRLGSTWERQSKLTASDAPTFLDLFGNSIDLHGDRAAIGASTDPPRGSVYLFERCGTTWVQLDKFKTSSASPGSAFGGIVALSEDEVFATDVTDKTAGPSASGAVLVQTLDETLLPWANIGFTLQGKFGPPYLDPSGTPTAQAPVTVTLSNAHKDTPVVLLISSAAAMLPFKGGTLVPGPTVLPIPGKTDKKWGVWKVVANWPAAVPSGFQLFLQCAIEDESAPQGVALSNVLLATAP